MFIDLIAGARPNFVKLAAIVDAIHDRQKTGSSSPLDYRIVHTGQHYDFEMSQSFFNDLGIPKPDLNLNAKSGSQAEQTAAIMIAYEMVLVQKKPDLCIVVGDVNSTMACAITAKKMYVDVAHVEAGIRSGDMRMPEEINRIVTDSITDYFFTTSEIANQNLITAGVPKKHIFYVGNTMIDTLLKNQSRLKESASKELQKLTPKNYIVVTLHRPTNVDEQQKLKTYLKEILDCSREKKIIFPAHPRTAKILEKLTVHDERLIITKPLGYLEFNYLVKHSYAVITDSGGVTEETTVMGIPCMTLRDSTERPETVEIGTNELLGTDPINIKPAMDKLFSGSWKEGEIPTFWDGKTGQRIIERLITIYES